MIDLATVYSNVSGSFPDVIAQNATGAGLTDGTEFIAAGINNGPEFGFMQSIMAYGAGGANAPTGTMGVPNGVSDGEGVNQIIEAMQRGFGIGPGKYVQWGLFDDPSVTLDRVLLLSNQGVLIATYPDLVTETYVGDGNNATKPFFYKAELADGLTRNTAGPFFILPPSRDYLFPNGPRITSAFWHTVNGYGGPTAIQKFVTEVDASDDVVVTVDNNANLGMTITANMACKITVTYVAIFSASGPLGLTKNVTNLNATITAVPADERVAISQSVSSNSPILVSWSGILATNDIIRPQTSGNADGTNPERGSIHIVAEETPRENSATVQGITY